MIFLVRTMNNFNYTNSIPRAQLSRCHL